MGNEWGKMSCYPDLDEIVGYCDFLELKLKGDENNGVAGFVCQIEYGSDTTYYLNCVHPRAKNFPHRERDIPVRKHEISGYAIRFDCNSGS